MKKITVDQNGEINTIQKAFDLINDNEEAIIYLKPGIYFEKLKLTKSNVKIIGESSSETIISFNDYAKKIKDGLELVTFRTYTLMILADNVTLENITIENTSGCGKKFGQSVALSTTGNNITINNCRLISYQDTLFLGPLPRDLIVRYQGFLPDDELIYPLEHNVFINNTYIEGDVDYVFGCGHAIFNNCVFFSKEREGFVFAPSTELDDNGGFEIDNCIFTSNYKVPHVYLARPWRDYGKVTIINSKMDNHIYDVGYDKWNDTNRDKTCRFNESNCSYFDNHKFERVYFVNKK